MGWTALALIMTVLMGGIIAYNGDLIGRKYGKRRLSLFNLRPKHTAILITSITGVFISGITTAALFLLVPQVREVILEGERAIEQLKPLKRDIVRQTNELGRVTRQLAKEQEKVTQAAKDALLASQRLAATQTKLQAADRNLRTVTLAKQQAENQRNLLRSENAVLLNDNRDLETQVAKHKAALPKLQLAIAQKQKANQEMEGQNVELSRDNIRLTSENAATAAEIGQKKADISQMNKILRNQAEDNSRLASENSVLQRQNADLAQRKLELEQRKAELEAAGVGFLTDWTQLYKRFEALRTRRIAIHGGEDLSRIVIPANARPDSVRKLIYQSMEDANRVAVGKGAKPGDQNLVRAIQVVDKQFIAETPFGSIRPVSVSEPDRINALVHKLSLVDTPVCLLVIAVANSVEGEPAAIDFQPFNDWLVYPKGRVIATHNVSGKDGPEKLFPNIMTFLKDLGQSAIQRGIIPRIDPMTGSPEVGSLNWTELVGLVDRVRRYSGEVHITAFAKDDTKASDPLNLDFKVDGS